MDYCISGNFECEKLATHFEDMYGIKNERFLFLTLCEGEHLSCMARPIFSAALLVHYNNSTCLRSSLVTVTSTSATWTILAAHSTEITEPLNKLFFSADEYAIAFKD